MILKRNRENHDKTQRDFYQTKEGLIMSDVTTAGMTAAVKAKWGEFDRPLTTPRIIEGWFSNLTSSEKALAVVCPVEKCSAGYGKSCIDVEKSRPGTCVERGPHPERVALVSDTVIHCWNWPMDGDGTICGQMHEGHEIHPPSSKVNCPACLKEMSPIRNAAVPESTERPYDEFRDGKDVVRFSEREKVELPYISRFRFNDISYQHGMRLDTSGEFVYFGTHETQLLSALEEVKNLKEQKAALAEASLRAKSRAECAEARVAELEDDAENKKLQFQFGQDKTERIAALESVVRELAKAAHLPNHIVVELLKESK